MNSLQEIKEIVSCMTLESQLLEMIMLDIRFFDKETQSNPTPVTKLHPEISTFLEKYPVGGIIFFRENIKDIEQIITLTTELQKNTKNGRFLAVDQEGGTVTRIDFSSTFSGNMALGAINDLEVTEKIAELIAKELISLGFNFILAPVLDVNSNPKNPIVGVRSFGENPLLVSQHGTAFLNGLKKQNIIACGKHFPGHGDTASDSHHSLPVIERSINGFRNTEFIPFKAASENGIDSIMTAHIIAKELDSEYILSNKMKKKLQIPSTLSSKVIKTFLRKEIGYNGVVISDALDMKAISDYFDPVEATLRCIQAGINIILMPIRIWNDKNIEEFEKYFKKVAEECKKSDLLTKSIFESCIKILCLKQKKVKALLDNNSTIFDKVERAKAIVKNKDHVLFEKKIANMSVTLVKNETNTLPWKIIQNEKIFLISANDIVAQDTLNSLHSIGITNISIRLYQEQFDYISEIQKSDKVIILSCNINKEDAIFVKKIIDHLNNLNSTYILISCQNPYDIIELDNAKANILVFGSSGIDQTNYSIRSFDINLREAIQKIFLAENNNEFNVHLPVKLEKSKK